MRLPVWTRSVFLAAAFPPDTALLWTPPRYSRKLLTIEHDDHFISALQVWLISPWEFPCMKCMPIVWACLSVTMWAAACPLFRLNPARRVPFGVWEPSDLQRSWVAGRPGRHASSESTSIHPNLISVTVACIYSSCRLACAMCDFILPSRLLIICIASANRTLP